MKKILNLLPLIAFALLVVVLWLFLTNDNDQLESVLADKSVPEFFTLDLENPEIIIFKSSINKLPASSRVGTGIVCKCEHPFLMKLKEESALTVYGLNYKDNSSCKR